MGSCSPEQLKYSQDNVVDIAESARLALFSVMKTPTPVDGNACGVIAQLAGCRQRGSGVLLTKIPHVVENRAVIRRAEFSLGMGVSVGRLGSVHVSAF